MQVKSTITEPNFRLLQRLPVTVQRRHGRKAVKKAATSDAKVVRKVIPESQKTRTRDKWSKKMKQARANTKPAKKAVKVKLAKKRNRIRADVNMPLMSLLTAPKKGTRQAMYWGARGPLVRGKTMIKKAVANNDRIRLNILRQSLRESLRMEMAVAKKNG